ncbi:hypothetical protein P167DRAFT_569368 [Morchella conica CCBAS932]|uniref:CNH domain-containing protein n=1 Tax=Morchella conica CCBAS932 TaxID=1392247 RepID=A0A3N4L835_9PEZI|nr:hypothetical protein P167DRAFT_569368 [Morchella conica CCBAS932]
MLNAFNARSILELGPRERFRIESLLAYGDKLLLGLSNGTLRVCQVLNPDTPEISLSLLRTIDKFSRRSIELLACIKEVKILVTLSDNYVHIHDLDEFTLKETLSKTKGATTFAVTSNIEKDETTQIPSIVSRLAIGIKKRLLLYSWHDEEFQEGKEVILSGAIRSLTWASGQKVVAGLSGGFVTVNVQTGAIEDIVPPESKGNGAAVVGGGEQVGWSAYMGMGGWGSKPLSTHLGGDELLLVKDTTSLFIDKEGNVIPDRPPIPWPVSPDSIVFSYPYLVSLNTSKQHLEVRNPSTQTLLQTIHLPNVSTLNVPPPNVSLVHAGKLFYVASPTQVWRMSTADYETQIKELVDGEHLDEAISLLEILENVLLKDRKEEKLREVQMLKAERLFDKKKYRESMDLFIKVSAPPERAIRLFPRVIAGDLSIVETNRNEEDTTESADSGDDDPSETAEDGGLGEATEATEATKSPEVVEQGDETLTTIQEAPEANKTPAESGNLGRKKEAEVEAGKAQPPSYLAELKKTNLSHMKKNSETSSIFSFGVRRNAAAVVPDDHSDTASITVKHTQTVPEAPPILQGDELKTAANELAAFLADTRREISKYFNADGKPLDTFTNTGSPTSPVSISKNDLFDASFANHTENVEMLKEDATTRLDSLMQAARLVDTTLFRIYIITNPRLVGPFVRVQKHGDPAVVSEKLQDLGMFTELVDFLCQKELHKEALELLRQFGQEERVDSRAMNLQGPQRTIGYLQNLKAAHIDLILEYARWPLMIDPKLGMEVFTTDSQNAESLPRGKVLEYLQEIDRMLAVQYLEYIINELGDPTHEFHTRMVWLYLQTLTEDDFDGREKERLKWREKLLDFLVSSKQYRNEKVLGWLPRDDPEFYEARAVVLSNMGQHKTALEIYVFKLKDHEKAEEYCAKIHHASPPEDPAETSKPTTVYHTLLSLYLRPPPGYMQQLGPALSILSRHGARLEASDALKLIPEDIKISNLETYFKSRIRHTNSRMVENRMAAQLRASFRVDVQERLLESRNKHVIVGEERVCPVCHKKLGTSVILRTASGMVVHYGCAQKEM